MPNPWRPCPILSVTPAPLFMPPPPRLPPELKPHGSVYFSWGYNREYTRSDIRFKNTTIDNYDFTFVKLRQRQARFPRLLAI